MGPDGHNLFLVYDCNQIYRVTVTEPTKELVFSINDNMYHVGTIF